jgi:hypothetical protein
VARRRGRCSGQLGPRPAPPAEARGAARGVGPAPRPVCPEYNRSRQRSWRAQERPRAPSRVVLESGHIYGQSRARGA